MKPSQTAQTLRKIAAAIDASKSPDRRLVARDLKKVLAAVGGLGGEFPDGGGEFPDGEQVNWSEIENTLFNALDNWTFTPGDTVVFDQVGGLDRLNEELGLNFFMTITKAGDMKLSVSFEGDSDDAWRGSLPLFNKQGKKMAAYYAVALAQQMLATSAAYAARA